MNSTCFVLLWKYRVYKPTLDTILALHHQHWIRPLARIRHGAVGKVMAKAVAWVKARAVAWIKARVVARVRQSLGLRPGQWPKVWLW